MNCYLHQKNGKNNRKEIERNIVMTERKVIILVQQKNEGHPTDCFAEYLFGTQLLSPTIFGLKYDRKNWSFL